MNNLSWITTAVIAGTLFGSGVLLTNSVTKSNIHPAVIITVFGLVWLISGGLLGYGNGVKDFTLTYWIMIVLAGIFFFAGNIAQFKSTRDAPFSAYSMVIITAVSICVVIVYDSVYLWYAGKLTFKPLQIAALVFGVLSVVLFLLSARK